MIYFVNEYFAFCIIKILLINKITNIFGYRNTYLDLCLLKISIYVHYYFIDYYIAGGMNRDSR